MSDAKTRSFTIRLTPEDQVALTQLCDLYGLDRPASLRQAIRHVLAQHTPLESSGYFVPVGLSAPSFFPVRMNRKRVDES